MSVMLHENTIRRNYQLHSERKLKLGEMAEKLDAEISTIRRQKDSEGSGDKDLGLRLKELQSQRRMLDGFLDKAR